MNISRRLAVGVTALALMAGGSAAASFAAAEDTPSDGFNGLQPVAPLLDQGTPLGGLDPGEPFGTNGSSPLSLAKMACLDQRLCLYRDVNFGGAVLYLDVATPNVGAEWNDAASTAWNLTGQAWCLYPDENYGWGSFGSSSVPLRIAPGEQVPELNLRWANDIVTSARPVGADEACDRVAVAADGPGA